MNIDLIVAIISSSVAIVVLIVSSIYRSRELKEKRNTERRNEILKSLTEFYGPLISYLNVVKALYKIFSSNKPKNFRTLTYLLNPDQEYHTENGTEKIILSETDQKLIEEIIELERKVEELIITKSGLVDDDQLMFNYIPNSKITDVHLENTSLIATAIAHFRLLRMAYDGHFRGEVERFKNFVYPREFDVQIKEKMDKLQAELDLLH